MINGRCEEGQPDGVDGSVRSLNNLEFHIEKKRFFFVFKYTAWPIGGESSPKNRCWISTVAMIAAIVGIRLKSPN